MRKLSKILSFALIGILLSNCNYQLEDNEAPKNLIKQEKFSLILLDLMLLESHVQMKYNSDRRFYPLVDENAQLIFEDHNIDSSQFNTSMDYYVRNQATMQEIYATIEDSLSSRKGVLEALEKR